MMVGLFFTVIPPLPGTIIIWGAAIGYGLLLGWDHLGWLTFALLTVLMLVGTISDMLAGQFGAKLGGASCLSIVLGTIAGFIVGMIASFIGTPILGCLAGLVGTLGGIVLIEQLRHRDWRTAVNATKGFAAGTTVGIMAKVTAGGLMFAIFLIRVYLWT